MKTLYSFALALMSVLSSGLAHASCQDQLYVSAPAPSTHIQQLCKHTFILGYNTKLKAPAWAAEHLTKQRLAQAAALPRKDYFHTEAMLEASVRRDLTHYVSDGLDRGHLAPNFDMPDSEAQYQSFSLANIVPQHAELNRGMWREVEDTVRDQVFDYGHAYVVTGALYDGRLTARGVPKPSYLYKAVFFPDVGVSGVYVSENSVRGLTQVISLSDFQQRYELNPMPSVQSSPSSAYFLAMPEQSVEQNDQLPIEWFDWSFTRLKNFVAAVFGFLGALVLG